MRHFRRFSRNYFRQMLTLSVGVLLLLCMVTSVVFFSSARNSTMKTMESLEIERTADLLRQADIFMSRFVSTNTVFSSLNIPYEQIDFSVPNYWTRTVFNRMIMSHENANNYTYNIDIILNGISTKPSTVPHERTLGKYSVFTIYTAAESVWPYYFDLTSFKRNGSESVTMTISAYHLSKQFLHYGDTERMDYLLLSDGTVLLSNSRNAFFSNIETVQPELWNQVLSDDTTLHTYGKYYASVSQPDKYGFRMLSLVDKNVYSPRYNSMLMQVAVMSLALLMMAVLISVFLTVRFYRPIGNMVKLLRTYIPEDLRDYENEIAFINQNVSKYVAKSREQESILPQTISGIQEAQAASMQHQINSHFLFNTLENIKAISISEMGIDNEIENSIMLLNNIIRESILQKNVIVSLAHEIHLADSYLQLMQIRFPGVQISWDIDESLLNCSVFKFSMQPVLENCFTHAFKSKTDKDRCITIEIRRFGEDFTIGICDNGCGIDEKTMRYLNELLIAGDESVSPRSVGIHNIQKRITAVFGKDYGITISSSPEKTTVSIRYPVTELRENESQR